MEKEHREDVLFHFEVLGPYKYTRFSNRLQVSIQYFAESDPGISGHSQFV